MHMARHQTEISLLRYLRFAFLAYHINLFFRYLAEDGLNDMIEGNSVTVDQIISKALDVRNVYTYLLDASVPNLDKTKLLKLHF